MPPSDSEPERQIQRFTGFSETLIKLIGFNKIPSGSTEPTSDPYGFTRFLVEVRGAKPVRTDRMERSAVDPGGDGPFCVSPLE